MSEYESLRSEIERMGSSYGNYAAAVDRYAEVVNGQVAGLWADNAELRDELHAVANRLENLTRAITTSPAEVAAAIVSDANRSTLREVRGDANRSTLREVRGDDAA